MNLNTPIRGPSVYAFCLNFLCGFLMTDVHYFPRYSQRENFATNNTLLLLNRFYQVDRFKCEKLFVDLADRSGSEFTAQLGLRFEQQVRAATSVPDMSLSQDSVRISVETKRGVEFDLGQLMNHLEGFGSETHKYLLLLGKGTEPLSPEQLERLKAKALERNVALIIASFEDIVAAARGCLGVHEEEMHELVADYEAFCSSENLLDTDRHFLFVPPCGQSFDINFEYQLYFCPISRNLRNTKFLGLYRNRNVSHVAEVQTVLTPTFDAATGEGLGVDGLSDEIQKRILEATKRAATRGWDIQTGHRFLLCGPMHETSFKKKAAGGIRAHRYVDLRSYLEPTTGTANDLAEQLRGRDW